MGYIALIAVVITLMLGIIEMKKASRYIELEWYKSLGYQKKIEMTSLIKSNWKTSIILIATNIGAGLVSISTFMGKKNSNGNVVNIFVIIVVVIIAIGLLLNNKKLTTLIEKFRLRN